MSEMLGKTYFILTFVHLCLFTFDMRKGWIECRRVNLEINEQGERTNELINEWMS